MDPRRGGTGRIGGSRTARSRSSAPAWANWAAPEPVDEVAPSDAPGLLHRAQDRIDRREAARDGLGGDRLAGQDAVPLEQGERERVQPFGPGGRPGHVRDAPRRATTVPPPPAARAR